MEATRGLLKSASLLPMLHSQQACSTKDILNIHAAMNSLHVGSWNWVIQRRGWSVLTVISSLTRVFEVLCKPPTSILVCPARAVGQVMLALPHAVALAGMRTAVVLIPTYYTLHVALPSISPYGRESRLYSDGHCSTT